MAKVSCLLSLSLCLLVLLLGCSARKQPQLKLNQARRQSECQLEKLNPIKPTQYIDAEAGRIGLWDRKDQQLQCAGVAFFNISIKPGGLLMPFYANYPQLLYVVEGNAIQGTVIPGCPESFLSAEGGKFRDSYQKTRRIRQGYVSAVNTGAAYWILNDGSSTFVAVVLVDISNEANQLDQDPRFFSLAGNPSEKQEELKEMFGSNIYGGFSTSTVARSLNVTSDIARKVQSKRDSRGPIVQTRRKGQEKEQESEEMGREREQEQEQEEKRRERRRGSDNGLDETICTLRLTESIDEPTRADIDVSNVGRISTVNSLTLPILHKLQLSMSRVVLYSKNVRLLPCYNVNADSVIFVTKGRARVQVVSDRGNAVFNGMLSEGEVLIVLQNYAVTMKAEERFEYVAFKTSENAMVYNLAGRSSLMRSLPLDIIEDAYQLSEDEAREAKFNQKLAFLVREEGESESDEWASA